MTADEVFSTVIALMFSAEEDKADYEEMFYPMLNIILGECFEVNNAMRRKNGKEPLIEIPKIVAAADPVPYEDILLRAAIPYGIAANLYAEDDENGITNIYRERYHALLNNHTFADFAETEAEL